MRRHGIPLAYENGDSGSFGFEQPAQPAGRLISYDGDAPICVIAPTGAGKGVNFLVPLLLSSDNPAIVIDLKGELSAVCARRRREMGHRVAVIDPFGITKRESDRLDPFELFDLPGSLLECDSEMLAAMLNEGHGVDEDPFWDDAGSSLIGGLVALAASLKTPEQSGLAFIRKHLFSDDAVYSVAVLCDGPAKDNPYAYRELTGFLQHADSQTRPCVLATARTFMRALNSPQVSGCLEDPTISLKDVMDGAPLDIFIAIPPEKVVSHAGLLRMLVGTLMTTIMRRSVIPEPRTLMVVDEAAQLGKEFAPILTASTLMRGYGLQLVTAWQDLAQMKSRYKADWQTILNNAGALLTFGMGHYAAAKDFGDVLGIPPHELLKLGAEEAVLAVRGEGARKVRRMDYLKDGRFAGLFDPNPYHSRNGKSR